jgi:hypothetical protein
MTITATGAPPPKPGTAPVPAFPFSMFDSCTWASTNTASPRTMMRQNATR